MKIKQDGIVIFFIIVVIVALFWIFGIFREGFTTVNNMLSDADAQSIAFNTNITPNASAFQNWFWNTYPNIAKYDTSITSIAQNLAAYAKLAPQSMSGAPDLNDFYEQLATALSAGKDPMFARKPEDVAKSYVITNPSQDSTGIYANVIYSYYFGNTPPATAYVPPASPAPAPAPAPATKPTPSPAPAPTPSPAPTPAPSSSSTQPMPLSIPSPCTPAYKSIPGGSIEFKCFNS